MKVTAKIYRDKKSVLCYKDEKGRSHKDVKAVFVFPHQQGVNYISILNEKEEELVMLKHPEKLSDASRIVIFDELEKRYFIPEILKIISLDVESHLAYWHVETDRGTNEFMLYIMPENVVRTGGNGYFFTDTFGNRFKIKDKRKLDKKSAVLLEMVI